MALRNVKDVIQSEVITALGGVAGLANVFAAKRLTAKEPLSPAMFPCAIVLKPEQQSFKPVNDGTAEASYSCSVDLFTMATNLAEADATYAETTHAMILAIEAHYTDALLNCGMHEGDVQVSDQGWGQVGQNLVFRIDLTYSIWPPTNQLVEDGIVP
ncbi:MAG: hypothetical protein M3447_09035 [Acidobacteriota bacterium]|nr:hypothetical protein [Acidobacteriota bacterium]